MQRARFWILCAMGALMVISGILLFGVHEWESNARSLKNMLPANVDMRLDNLTRDEIGADGRRMRMKADTAHYFKTEDYFLLDKVRAEITTDSGFYDIVSDRGRYEQSKQIIELEGQVQVIDGDGGVLTSEKLILKFEEGHLISEDDFCYANPTVNLSGSSFIYYTREKLLSAEGRNYLFID